MIDSKGNQVNPESILHGHRERTTGRMKNYQRVLAIQDTTDLDFSERLHCNGLGDIGKNQTGAVSQGLKIPGCVGKGSAAGGAEDTDLCIAL